MMKSVRSKLNAKARRSKNRRMGIETLENRSLLAGDLLHNFIQPEDSDGNGSIDPLDALIVINQLNRGSAATSSATGEDPRLVDVDADNALTPLDALVVINHLNSDNLTAARVMRASRVDVERRIERLELAIVNDALPPNMTVENAEKILATLRSGGRPELGDRIVDGLLHWKQDVTPVPERVEAQPIEPDPESDTSRAIRFASALSQRLAAFGVKPQVIETISSEIKESCEAGEPMQIPEIRDRLADLGVDVDAILPLPGRPDQPDRPDRPIMPTIVVTEPIANSIIARLNNAGVTAEVIETITTEIWDAIKAGTPLDIQQVRSRLAALGVDWEKLGSPRGNPPARPDQPGQPDRPDRPIMPTIVVTEPIANSIIARLNNAGVTPEVIETITTEIWDAIRAGTPLDIQQVRSRLEELGVDWEKLHTPPKSPTNGRPELDVGDTIRKLVPILARLGINREVISTIYSEAQAAAESGKPMTFEQVVARLKELGVSFDAFKLAV